MKLRLILFLLLFPSISYAQDVNDYTPPPLFGGGEDVRDSIPEVKALPKKQIIIEKSIPSSVPLVAKPKVKPKKNFAKPLKKKKKRASTGVVKEPKVMPAVKKQNVETEVIFEPKTKMPPNLTNNFKRKPVPKKPKKEKSISLSVEISTEKNWVLSFDNTTDIKLSEEYEKLLLEKIVPQMDANIYSRLFIESFATHPNEKSNALSADRRIALSRALAVRSYLIEQEIASNRIDVRAFGENDAQNKGKAALNQIKIHILE
jgi:hypothetical protein